MSTSLEIACQILPYLKANVLKGWQRTYGHYASAIDRDPAKEGIVIGKAMHVIGAACIMTKTPIAPIHYVERADGEWRGIFEKAASESIHVAPTWDTLAVTSRIHKYSETDFDRLDKALSQVIPKYFSPEWRTPKNIWIFLIHRKAQGDETWFLRALNHYQAILNQAKNERREN